MAEFSFTQSEIPEIITLIESFGITFPEPMVKLLSTWKADANINLTSPDGGLILTISVTK